MKKVLKYAGFGFVLGVAVSSVITILTGDPFPASSAFIERVGNPKGALLTQALLSGLYGALCMGTVPVYDNERLPLSLSSLIHCLCCILPFIPLSLFLGWSASVAEVLIMAGFQLAAYFVIWLILYVRYKKQAKELNEIQRQRKNTPESEEETK
ncbi:MAG: DUF3021 domain-containing protein [Lachnospiraceae bacterium]|nr:DUF3021 domain-containing protein [Lachnospiraceae bacterium]